MRGALPGRDKLQQSTTATIPAVKRIATPGILFVVTSISWGQTAPPAAPPTPPDIPTQQIEVTGNRESDTEQRRQATASKIVIGREEIDKFGDSTVGEVLRRLPGVTTPGAPGRGGPPRMRGLGNGYTQLLIDGQRIPPGFSLESLTPEQVERIEILRAPTAETGARAIAGTINIITREGYRRRINDLRLGVARENGAWSPSGSWTHNDSTGALTYNLSASAFGNHRLSNGSTETTDLDAGGALAGQQLETSRNDEHRQGLNLTSRLQWRLGEGGDLLALSPSLFHTESHARRQYQLAQTLPAPPALPLYDSAESANRGRFTVGRLNGQWRQRLESGWRVEMNGGLGGWRSFSDTLRHEMRNVQTLPLRTLQDSATTREHSGLLSGKLSQLLGGQAETGDGAHDVAGGFELESISRSESHTTTQDGVPLLVDFGDNLQASSQRLAAYAQDEWRLSPHWSASAGLRWEAITTRGDADAGVRPTNRSSVATPLLHAVWKPDPKGRDQLRISLTRSYRAPALGTLIARPSINSKYPAGGPNTPTSPDRVGNPALKPELATGVDIAYERYLSGGGLLSANLFQRRIRDLMRSVTTAQPVSVGWSPVPRYVARQENIGDAMTQGLELEAKFALDQMIDGAPRIEMRSNLSLYRSRVEGVPGPDNRLDQQARLTANLGADYRFRGTPMTVGGNLNVVPGYSTRLAEDQRTRTGSKCELDAFALWTFNPALGLRLLASNLAARDYESSNTIDGETARSFGPSYINWQLRLELKI
jgi:iron complex outermembrane receptor protein